MIKKSKNHGVDQSHRSNQWTFSNLLWNVGGEVVHLLLEITDGQADSTLIV